MSAMNLSLNQALAWLPGAQAVGDTATVIARVHTDSRSLQAGDLFVALKGERFDGGQFLAQAQAAGAAAALCEPSALAQLQHSGLPGIVVPNANQALGALASAWRAQFKLPLIVVTGSNGKTTVTQMIAAILRAYKPGATLATQGNLNNHIGVPLTLLNLRSSHRAAVVELGMNHPGEIAQLAAMAQATVALVNNAQREHQEFMATVDAVAQENGAALAALGPRGVAVFPGDEAYSALWQTLAGQRPVMHFSMPGSPPDATDVHCEDATWAAGAWAVRARTPVGVFTYPLAVAGRHNVKNSLAAAACALALGVPLATIAQGLSSFEPVKGRSRALALRWGKQTITVVDDSYNANPDSVRAAIEVLAELPGRRLLVLGDMGEVGDQGPAFHAEVGAYARQCGIDALFTLGDLCAHAATAFTAGATGSAQGQHFQTLDALQAAVQAALPATASIVIKGSRFMRMEQVVQHIVQCSQHRENTDAA